MITSRRRWKSTTRVHSALANHRYNYLLRRARISVGLHFVPLFFHNAAPLAFHCLKRVVDPLGERLMRAIVLLPFIGHEFVAARNGHIDAHPKLIAFLI